MILYPLRIGKDGVDVSDFVIVTIDGPAHLLFIAGFPARAMKVICNAGEGIGIIIQVDFPIAVIVHGKDNIRGRHKLGNAKSACPGTF